MRTNGGMRETDRRDEVRLRDLSCGDRATSTGNTPQFPRENYGACVRERGPTRRKEAVSFPFPAAERRKKFIVGGREGGESSGETETGPRAGEADMGAALDEGPDHKCIKDFSKLGRHSALENSSHLSLKKFSMLCNLQVGVNQD